MSQANQVAIAGPSALTEPPRSVRNGQHNIPRFLLKLYEIINDPANEELIKWSEAGDSFYIYHQERFAREVLGKWFKHQNFSSFVRQLNLYGFRKISALQQGLLRMDHDNETIQFAHPYFHRGQPDLLALIQRKRHPPSHTQAEEAAAGLLQASQEGKLDGQAVDVRSIVDGISAIRRQQQAIAADLSALKQSNDALWKEAIEARQRHAKHEDTINRILKFLAGLFGRVMQGHNREQLNGDGQEPPKRQMLMIEDSRPSHGDSGGYFADLDAPSDTGSRAPSPFSVASERFATVETPDASIASPAVESVTKSPPKSSQRFAEPQSQDNKVSTGNSPLSASSSTTVPSLSTAVPPELGRRTPNPEALWQTTFQYMLNSPAQFQRIVQAFNNNNLNQAYPLHPSGPAPGTAQPYSSELSNALQFPASYGPPVPPPSTAPQQQQQQHLTYPPVSGPSAQPAFYAQPQFPVPLSPVPNENALLDNSARLQKTYNDTAEINADIDVLQSNIHSLIRDMGLDPNNVSFPNVPGVGAIQGGSGLGDEGEFPFDSWLNQISSTNTPSAGGPGVSGGIGHSGGELPTFMDFPGFDAGVPSSASATTPSTNTDISSPVGQKRKLEVVEIPEAESEADSPSNKKKR
ncbi:hypothetical protein BN946_scf185014.g98 [Trametes cinnabarina]|uniref:HSF-type DNA-binding domain-containing protein n=1 Tax=Pycnoporus cinnabarinus TaxID=5643 RepID=A0A060SMH8_PYCCI|nr:hypothetical protein BN946_scf185014.g98 [Trametes cinnabarina]